MSWSIIKKILLCSFVFVVTLLYWELGLRMLGKTAFPLLRTDPEVGSIYVKNFTGFAWDVLSARKNYIHTNSMGYVGNDVSVVAPTSTIRIAFLGDSGLAALQVDYRNNFIQLLEDELNTNNLCGQKFQLMNFGVGSAGTFSEYQTYKKKIAPFHPDYVLVLFSNDYDDNIIKSGYDLENYAEERKSVGLKAFLLKFELPKFIYHKLIGNKVFISLLHAVGILEGDSELTQAVKIKQADIQSAAQTDYYYGYTFDIFTKFNELVTSNGSRFGTIIFPNEQTDYVHIGAWKDNENVTKLIDFLTSAKIPVFNPSDLLAHEKSQQNGCLTFDCASHFNEVGHRAMAKILHNYVRDELLKDNLACKQQ